MLVDEDTIINDGKSFSWKFPENEIQLSDTILGRGAFGEVRVATWRGIQIAAKKLHFLGTNLEGNSITIEQASSIVSNLRREVEILSRLRHPNLVLFLGVAYDLRSDSPTTILTELLSASLYDVMEVHKIKLTLADIIDISFDISCGIQYLHSHVPEIVHRDISSKNILLGGNKAKIADLGQSKILHSSLGSRQTGMPGAMAYSAPEVLTGKYTSKIDIFSFGVLLVQMSIGEYPRIDKREDQLELACSNFPIFETVMRKCLAFQPFDRLSAEEICSQVQSIRQNDRFYPPVRRMAPQSEVGVLARRWMNNELEERCRGVRLNLEQANRRLVAEEQRWRDEADRTDKAEKRVKELEAQLASSAATVAVQGQEMEKLEKTVSERDNQIRWTNQLLEEVNRDKVVLQGRVTSLEEQLRLKSVEVHTLRLQATEDASAVSGLKQDLVAAKTNERRAVEKEGAMRLQLEMQLSECRDLEARLEQALNRWKHEKENLQQENAKCGKLRSQCALLADKNTRLSGEIDRLASRLRMYDSLPMPEEIRLKMAEMESDVRKREALATELTEAKATVDRELADALERLSSLEMELNDKETQIVDLKTELRSRDKELQLQQTRCQALEKDFQTAKDMYERVVADNISLKDNDDVLKAQLKELEAILREDNVARNSVIRIRNSISEAASRRRTRQFIPRTGAGTVGFLSTFNDESSLTEPTVDLNLVPGSALEGPSGVLASVADRDTVVGAGGGGSRGLAGEESTEVIPQLMTDRNEEHDGRPYRLPDLVLAVSATGENLEELARARAEGDAETALEMRRKQDKTAKVLVAQAVDHFGPLGLLRLMREHKQDSFIIWRGARQMRDLVLKSDEVRAELITAKCHDTIVDGMLAFPYIALVQGQCLRTLGTLAFGNDQVRRHAGERGALKSAADSLETHAEDETVMLHALTAITNLTHNSLDNRSRFVEVDGVKALIAAMTRHCESVKIQRQACWALLTLAGGDDGARAVSQCGGAAAVMMSMTTHRMDPAVQQFGCWAISNMALAGEEIKLKMQQTGVPEMCRVAMESHPFDTEVVRQARNALGIFGPLNSKKLKKHNQR